VAYAKATLGLLGATGADVILDRSHLSLWAYAADPSYMPPLIAALEHLRDVATDTPLDVRDEDFETAIIRIGVIPVEVARPRI